MWRGFSRTQRRSTQTANRALTSLSLPTNRDSLLHFSLRNRIGEHRMNRVSRAKPRDKISRPLRNLPILKQTIRNRNRAVWGSGTRNLAIPLRERLEGHKL